jgi:coenzyme Q-binding protein COQ10
MSTHAYTADSQATRNVAPAAWPRPALAGLNARDQGARRVIASRRLHHGWKDLYDLVLDLERYPAFVPGCRAVKIYSRASAPAGRTVIVSRMTVGFAGFDVSYANRTTGDSLARRIEVKALDGPLRRLDVLWTFEPDGEKWTEVGFSVDYAFDSAILSAVASRAFAAMFGEILAAFERRADRLFTRDGTQAEHDPGKPARTRTS